MTERHSHGLRKGNEFAGRGMEKRSESAGRVRTGGSMSALGLGCPWSEWGQVAQCPHLGRYGLRTVWLNVRTYPLVRRPPRLGVNRCAQCLSAHSTGLKTLGGFLWIVLLCWKQQKIRKFAYPRGVAMPGHQTPECNEGDSPTSPAPD